MVAILEYTTKIFIGDQCVYKYPSITLSQSCMLLKPCRHVLAQVRPTSVAWFLVIALVCKLCVVCLPPKACIIVIHARVRNTDIILHMFAKVGMVTISNEACCKHLPKETKVMIYVTV